MNEKILLFIAIVYVVVIVFLIGYEIYQTKVFKENIKKMTSEINDIIAFSEKKQKELKALKKKQRRKMQIVNKSFKQKKTKI